MSSNSSRSSKTSSRASNTSRSTSTRATSRPYFASWPPAGQPHRSNARSLRDIQEDLETYELQIANAKASEQHALNKAKEAESRARILAQERDRKRMELIQQSGSNAPNTNHGLPPARVIERSPDDYVERGLTSKNSTSGGSHSGRSSKSSKSKRVRFEVVGISRPARPKTIWGTPAWA